MGLLVDTSATGGVPVTTPGIDTTGAKIIVVSVASYPSATSSITDSKSNTWTALTSFGSDAFLRQFYCIDPVVGSGHTFTASSGSNAWMCAQAFDNDYVFFGESHNSASAVTSIQPGSLSPGDDALFVTALYCNSNSTPTLSSSFTIDEINNASGNTIAGAYKESATAENPTWATFTSGALSALTAMAVFKVPAPPTTLVRENVGRSTGGVIDGWSQNTIITSGGGSPQVYSSTPDLSALTDPATMHTYQHALLTTTTPMSGTVTGLTPSAWHLVRLHYYAEQSNILAIVNANGDLAANFGDYDAAGAKIQEFYIQTDVSGTIGLSFEKVSTGMFINGIEVMLQDPPADAEDWQIVCEGDSISGSYPNFDQSYPEQLAGLLDANFYNCLAIGAFDPTNHGKVRGVGIPGSSAAYMATRAAAVDALLEPGLSANIIVVLIGANNLIPGYTGVFIEDAIETYCLDRQAAGWTVYVGTVTPSASNYNPAAEAERITLNNLLRTNYPAYATGIIDFAADERLTDSTDLTYFHTDNLHLNTAGHGVMAEIAAAAIEIPSPFGSYDVLQMTPGLRLESITWTGPVLRASFGSGYGAQALVGNASGLHRWSLHSGGIWWDGLDDMTIDGVSRFEYYWEFFKAHTTGETEIFIIEWRDRFYHAQFADVEMSVEKFKNELIYQGGIEVVQRRLAGVTYNEDGSIS